MNTIGYMILLISEIIKNEEKEQWRDMYIFPLQKKCVHIPEIALPKKFLRFY